jgi:hypothetical protein
MTHRLRANVRVRTTGEGRVPMNLTAMSLAYDGHGMAASATSAGRRAAVRERSVGVDFTSSTGEVRLQAGANAMAALTPTAGIWDPERVRSWSPPV